MDPQRELRAENLTRHFRVDKGTLFSRVSGHVRAVDGVSFGLRPGRTIALVGESGCGKTTIARLLLRLEEPTSGRVLLGEQDVHELRGRGLAQYRRQVQAVFQNPYASLNPQRRVKEAVGEALTANGGFSRSEIREMVAQALERVGLSRTQASHYPHEFSGGQRQRIAIASALVSNPSIVVLDEPVSALDVSIGAQIMNLFRDLQEELGLSYLLISHDLATTRFMSSDVAVMYLGKLVEFGPTEQVFRQPHHPYTSALLDASPPSHPSQRSRKAVIKGEVPSPMNPPPGCSFHPRCPFAEPGTCDTDTPMLREVGENLSVACHFAEQIVAGSLAPKTPNLTEVSSESTAPANESSP